MKIKRIKLQDWGIHKHLDHTTDAQVLGLIGTNGSGKSLVLKAVEFAFTGIIEGKAETWVRDYGQGEAKNASVTVWFEKNGRQGMIFRQIGATSKRCFEWDGVEFTKAKDVEAALEELFGADRQAIGGAVFVAQGELDRMLFGTQADRETMWQKLMLLNFLDARHTLIDRKIGLLSANIQDFTQSIDSLNARITESEQAAALKEIELGALPDVSSLRTALDGLILCDQASEEAGRDLAAIKAQHREAQASSQAAMGRLHQYQMTECDVDLIDVVSIRQLREVRDQMTAELMKAATQLEGLRELEALAKRVKELEALKDTQDQECMRLLDDLARQPNIAQLEQQLKQGTDALAAASAYDTACEQLSCAQEDNTRTTNELLTKMTEGKPWDDAMLSAESDDELLNKIGMLELKVRIAKTMAQHQTCDMTCCPVCDRDMDHYTGPSPEKIAADDTQLDTLRAELRDARALRNQRQAENTAWQRHIDRLRDSMRDALNRQSELETKCTELRTLTGNQSQAEWFKTTSDIRRQITAVRALTTEHAVAARLFSDTAEQLSTLKAKPGYEAAAGVTQADVWRATQEKTRLEQVADSMNNQMSVIEDLYRKSETLAASAKVLTDNLSKLEAKVAACRAEVPSDLYDKGLAGWTSAQVELREQERRRSECQGELTQARVHVNTLRDERRALDARVATDARVRAVIEQLRQLKETLSRGGLPMSYMNHTFGQLVDQARNHLAEIGANFDVTIDPSRPLSLLFTRTDTQTGYTLPQEKLSGGQRVRLAIAMLLAVQSVLLPDVGLLVLDEPSNHMDDEGAERIRDLLFDVGRHVGTTDMQVLICDHKEALLPAFGSVIRLNKQD